MILSCQIYQKAHVHDGINKYARLEKPPVNTLVDMACTRNIWDFDTTQKLHQICENFWIFWLQIIFLPILFKFNLSRQKYQKTHLHNGINKYARLEKPPVNTLGDMAHTRNC